MVLFHPFRRDAKRLGSHAQPLGAAGRRDVDRPADPDDAIAVMQVADEHRRDPENSAWEQVDPYLEALVMPVA